MKKETMIKRALALLGILIGLSGETRDMQYVRAVHMPNAEIRLLEKDVAQAENEIKISELSQLMMAEQDVDMKVIPQEGAEIIMSYEAGAPVFVTGETDDGWYRVIYQDKVGYIPKDALSIQEIDVEALDEEMARIQQETQFVADTVERYRADAHRSKIWGSVIIALVLGVFATGILSGIRGSKNKEEKEV